MARSARAAPKRTPAVPSPVAPVRPKPWLIPAISVALLIPCFWQSRIQAGDLSSHIYNAWLARLISEGRAPGLALARQSTNVLFDLMLSALFPVGAGVAQRIAVSIALLVFVWGAFAWTSAVAGRRAWHVLPVIAVLAYGWVFHIGFFNFFLSLGLCFFAAALLWKWKWIPAGALLILAWTAHALPVLWIAALIAYAEVARRVAEERRGMLLGGAAVGIVVLRLIVDRVWLTHWFSTQVMTATGLEEVVVFDDKYAVVLVGVLALWVIGLINLVRDTGWQRIAAGAPLHWCVLTALGVAILPSWVKLPQYQHALAYIADRMALAMGIAVCVLISAARARAYQYYISAAVLLVFFAMLYADESAFNAMEDRVDEAVAQLPAGQRVINGIGAPSLRISTLDHMIDRACIGHCYSYANYEPSTAQFRVRVVGQSPLVISNYTDSFKLQTGGYLVQEHDVPLYQLISDTSGQIDVRELPAGSPVRMTIWNPLGH
jgi:hypothetical protein